MPNQPPTAVSPYAPRNDGVPTATAPPVQPAFRKTSDCDDLAQTARWRKQLRPVFLDLNPLCQFIDPTTGKQCDRAAKELHHVHGATRQNYFTWSGIVGLCPRHHHKHPGDVTPRRYVPTRGLMGAVYKHES